MEQLKAVGWSDGKHDKFFFAPTELIDPMTSAFFIFSVWEVSTHFPSWFCPLILE
jgi:hypothetical protein